MNAVAAAPASWTAVRAAYYAFVLWIPVETLFYFKQGGNEGEGGITIARLLGILLFGLAVLNARSCFRRLPAAFWMLALYLAAYAASQLWIPGALDAKFHARRLTMIQLVALFVISVNLFEEEGFRESLLRFYGWWVSLVAGAMLLGTVASSEGRSTLSEQNPNVLAGAYALAAVCLAGDPRLFTSKRPWARVLLSALPIAVLILAILKTGSRGGLTVFCVGILALSVCGGAKTRVRRFFIVAAVIGALALRISQEFAQRTQTSERLDAAWSRGDTTGRDAIWRACRTMIREKPLLGYGVGYDTFTLGIHMNYPNRDPHSLLFGLLLEVGLIGAFPFIAAIFHTLWRAWRHGARAGDALPFALMAALITMNIPQTGHYQKIFWIVFAAAVASGAKLEGRGKEEAAS